MKKGNIRQLKNRPYVWQLTLLTVVLSAGITRAQEIELVGHLDPVPGTDYADVWGAGDYAYLGTVDNGVFIVDISNSASPQMAFHYQPGRNFQDVKVVDGIGYFASDCCAIHIVDLSDPSLPTLLTQITSQDGLGRLHNVSVSGNFLYAANGGSENYIPVFDISTPSAPQFIRDIRIGRPNSPAGIHDITALGNRLYTSDINLGTTQIYDVTNMSVTEAPIRLGSFGSGSATHSNWVTEDGNVLANARECGGTTCGVGLFDISDPGNSILLANILDEDFGFEASSPHNPLIMDDFLYVSWYEAGLQIFDISDPSDPVQVGAYDTYDGADFGFQGNWGVYPFLGEDRVLLSDRDNGLFIVDVSAVVPEPSATITGPIALLTLLGISGGARFGRR